MKSALGISIYPEKTSYEENIAYLDLAAKYRFTKVFTSMLQIPEDVEEMLQSFKEVIQYANQLGMEVILDVNPFLLPKLGASWKDLSFFSTLGIQTLRLDGGYSGLEEMFMSHNPYHINIEVNMSSGIEAINRLMSFSPNKDRMRASYNFYPHQLTGMTVENVMAITKQFRLHHIPTSIFVTASSAHVGPWKLQQGLCTLEEHRPLSLKTQIKHIRLLDLSDDIIIGNCFASEAELIEASEAFFSNEFVLDVYVQPDLTDSERTILFSNSHFVRAEYSGYMIRSAFSRHLHKDEKIAAKNVASACQFGSVIIDNERYGQYENELQIVLASEIDTTAANKVAQITADDLKLLPALSKMPYQKFVFNQVEEGR